MTTILDATPSDSQIAHQLRRKNRLEGLASHRAVNRMVGEKQRKEAMLRRAAAAAPAGSIVAALT